MTRQSGFSLIEALVALVVLAVSAMALIGATEAYVARIRGLEDRAAAQWVAENTLAGLRLDPSLAPPDSTMLGRTWHVDLDYTPTDDPELSRVVVRVREAGEDEAQTTLIGFVQREGGLR